MLGRLADADCACREALLGQDGDPDISAVILAGAMVARNEHDELRIPRRARQRASVSQYVAWVEGLLETAKAHAVGPKRPDSQQRVPRVRTQVSAVYTTVGQGQQLAHDPVHPTYGGARGFRPILIPWPDASNDAGKVPISTPESGGIFGHVPDGPAPVKKVQIAEGGWTSHNGSHQDIGDGSFFNIFEK